MIPTPKITSTTFQHWIVERLELSQVKDKLVSMGCDEESINLYLREFKKLKYGKRQNKGFLFIALGSFLGFVSCVMTMINPIPEYCGFFLYGLTSFAILVVLLGLYLVFE